MRQTWVLISAAVFLAVAVQAVEPEVELKRNDDGSYRCTTKAYDIRFSKDGNVLSLKAGPTEFLAAAHETGAAAGFVFNGKLVPFKKITQPEPDSLVCEGDPKDPATAVPNAVSTYDVKAAWKFFADHIEVRLEQSLEMYGGFGWFPSAAFLASHDNLTDQPIRATGPILYQQTDPRWTTTDGPVLRFDLGVWQKGFANANWREINVGGKVRRFMAGTVPATSVVINKLFGTGQPSPKDALVFDLSAGSPDFLLPGGKPAHLNLKALNAGPQSLEATVRVEIKDYLTRQVLATRKTKLALASKAEGAVNTDLVLAKPGPYWATLNIEDAAGRDTRSFTITFVYDFQNYQPASTRPADFKQFWQEARAESVALPLDAKLTPVPEKSTATITVFKVNYATLAGRRIYGWYARPKAPGKYPAQIRFPSSGIYPVAAPEMSEDRCCLWIMIHGFDVDLSNMPKEADPGKNYWTAGIERPQTSMWRTIYMSLTRAIDFMVTQPEVDAERLAVVGGSQGGGLSLVAAGLDPRVKFCMTHHSGLGRLDWTVKYEPGYWPFTMSVKPKDQTEEQFLKTLSYFDAANFTADIQCPVYAEFGLMDSVTAPGNQICAVAHVPKGKLLFVCSPWAMHGGGSRDATLAESAYTRFRKGERPYFTPTKP